MCYRFSFIIIIIIFFLLESDEVRMEKHRLKSKRNSKHLSIKSKRNADVMFSGFEVTSLAFHLKKMHVYARLAKILPKTEVQKNVLHSLPILTLSDGDGVVVDLSSLARIFLRMFDHSFPACVFSFLFKWRLAGAH